MIRRVFVLVSLIVAAGRAQAQDRVASGVVFDSLSGEPVPNATLYVQGRRDEFQTDSYGRFNIKNLHRWDTLLVVRRIRYVASRVVVPDAPDGLAMDLGTVRMRAVATRLDQIAVEAEEVNRFPQLADFYRRKQANRAGVFVTREDIARTGVRKTSEMLRRNGKLELDCPPQLLGSDQCVARSRRGRAVARMFRDAAQGRTRAAGAGEIVDSTDDAASTDRCQMEVWVDGRRSSMGVDEIPVSWIAGVEVYNGLTQTPPAFGHGACGVIAIWTTGS